MPVLFLKKICIIIILMKEKYENKRKNFTVAMGLFVYLCIETPNFIVIRYYENVTKNVDVAPNSKL